MERVITTFFGENMGKLAETFGIFPTFKKIFAVFEAITWPKAESFISRIKSE